MDSLEGLRKKAGPYPTDKLQGCETALLLFGAGFLGMNDAIHVADAGMHGTVVDTDREMLERMLPLYPADWVFVEGDAWWFAEHIGASFDVVSVDCFTGDAELKAHQTIGRWCSMASRLVTMTKTRSTPPVSVLGWESSLMRRSGRADWLVLERL